MENSPVTLGTPFTAYSTPIQQSSQVSMIIFVVCYLPVHCVIVAGEPSKLTGVISSSNNTHVNITVSRESPADTVTTGYVIYYHPKTGGPVISESVTGRHRESHSLTGLQRGHTYNISIVALSQHIPTPLVGPVNVATGEPLNACSLHLLIILSHKVHYWWLRPHLSHSM